MMKSVSTPSLYRIFLASAFFTHEHFFFNVFSYCQVTLVFITFLRFQYTKICYYFFGFVICHSHFTRALFGGENYCWKRDDLRKVTRKQVPFVILKKFCFQNLQSLFRHRYQGCNHDFFSGKQKEQGVIPIKYHTQSGHDRPYINHTDIQGRLRS